MSGNKTDSMADSRADSRAESKIELTCSICYDIFKWPITMTCQHTFCKACIAKCAIYSEKFKIHYVKCPLCRQKCFISLSSFNNKNNLLNGLICLNLNEDDKTSFNKALINKSKIETSGLVDRDNNSVNIYIIYYNYKNIEINSNLANNILETNNIQLVQQRLSDRYFLNKTNDHDIRYLKLTLLQKILGIFLQKLTDLEQKWPLVCAKVGIDKTFFDFLLIARQLSNEIHLIFAFNLIDKVYKNIQVYLQNQRIVIDKAVNYDKCYLNRDTLLFGSLIGISTCSLGINKYIGISGLLSSVFILGCKYWRLLVHNRICDEYDSFLNFSKMVNDITSITAVN